LTLDTIILNVITGAVIPCVNQLLTTKAMMMRMMMSMSVENKKPKRHLKVWIDNKYGRFGDTFDTDDWHLTEEEALKCEETDE
jgi:hypothetical protein